MIEALPHPPLPNDPTGGQTYQHQSKLSKLPIPDLQGTIERYLAAVKPLQVKIYDDVPALYYPLTQIMFTEPSRAWKDEGCSRELLKKRGSMVAGKTERVRGRQNVLHWRVLVRVDLHWTYPPVVPSGLTSWNNKVWFVSPARRSGRPQPEPVLRPRGWPDTAAQRPSRSCFFTHILDVDIHSCTQDKNAWAWCLSRHTALHVAVWSFVWYGASADREWMLHCPIRRFTSHRCHGTLTILSLWGIWWRGTSVPDRKGDCIQSASYRQRRSKGPCHGDC